jgi:acyl-CoA synthetase (AMP-forming)/AMP-acid ligase II
MAAADFLARPFGNIGELVRMHAAEEPRRVALVQDERTLDYAALDKLMDRVAAKLQREGSKTIAMCSLNSIDYGVVFLGALRAGIAVALVQASSTPESIAAMVADSGAAHLFLDAGAAQALAPVAGRIHATRIEIDNSGAALEAWLGKGDRQPSPVTIDPAGPFNIVYSSGTTGTPKGVVQPNAMRWLHMQRGPQYGYGPKTTTLISTPLYSNTTLVSFFPALACGGTVVLMAKFEALAWLKLAERHRVTHTMLVPVQYQRLMAHPDFGRHDLSAFRVKFSTSAPFAADLKADILKRWPGGLVEYYGMTEGGGTCVLLAHEHPHKLHTVGLPAPGHDIRLVDDAGREVPGGGTGEVVGRSGTMMTCYHNQPEQTAHAEWHDPEGRRYIRTGDVGRFDEDGFLVLLDRKKDMIISGGFNIFPADLEAVLRAHPDVDDAAVVGVPSEKWGETPVAFVVGRGGTALHPGLVREWANARLGKLQRLAVVEVVASLPRSAIGKVLKRELRDAWQRGKAAR